MNLRNFILFSVTLCAVCLRMEAQEPDSIKQEAQMEQTLKELVIKSEIPLVKSKGGRLIYSVPRILKNSTAANAFEILKEVPGITGVNDNIELAGASGLKIVINGKISSMTMSQLIQMLKSMPASRVENVEVMYLAPAKYNFNGSVINVVLSSPEEKNAFMGEAGGEYAQYKYPAGKVYTNLLYAVKGWNIDFLFNFGGGKWYKGEDIYARHNYKGEIIPVEQSGRRTTKTYGGVSRLEAEYTFPDKSRLSGAYYLSPDKISGGGDALIVFGKPPVKNLSTSYTEGRKELHNFSFQYERPGGFSAGGDYTYYAGKDKLYYTNSDGNTMLTDMYNPSLQRVSRAGVYLNNADKAGEWTLEYGISGSYNGSHNKGEYYYRKGGEEHIEDMRQKEYSTKAYLEAGRSLGEKFSFKAGLKGEYFYARNSNSGVVWNKYTVYPTLSLNYIPDASNIFQFNISSDVTYPDYWALSSRKVPLNAYSYLKGNPELMPYRTYTAQLVYILKSKYIFVGFYGYSPGYFAQLPYQKEDELATVFEMVNFNFKQNYGISVILPFRAGRVWESKVTLTGVRMHEKNDKFHSIGFNRSGLLGAVEMLNTFKISSLPGFTLSLHGKFTTPGAIQGLFDFGYTYPVSVAVKYLFAGEQAAVTLSADDIFASSLPSKMEINTAGQYSLMKNVNETRCIKLVFSYKFGGYKKRRYKEVDRSRF